MISRSPSTMASWLAMASLPLPMETGALLADLLSTRTAEASGKSGAACSGLTLASDERGSEIKCMYWANWEFSSAPQCH